jgi:hypothetical protein
MGDAYSMSVSFRVHSKLIGITRVRNTAIEDIHQGERFISEVPT